MQLLVPMRDLALLVDPDKGILYALALRVVAWFMYANGDR